jgi:hypothetical protein
MRKSLFRWIVTFVVIAFVAVAAFAQTPPAKKPDATGTWIGKAVVSEDGTQFDITVVLSKTETGYAGKLSDASGMLPETELRKVVFKDDKLTFEFDLVEASGITLIQIELVLENETLKGVWSSPEGDSGTIELQRQK